MTDWAKLIEGMMSDLSQLDIGAYERQLGIWTRGGLPNASFGEGRGSSEPPLPGLDGFDRTIAENRRMVHGALERASSDIALAFRAVQIMLRPAERMPDPLYPCKRAAEGCMNVHERIDGLCPKCRQREARKKRLEGAA